jgi:hypothetical protein
MRKLSRIRGMPAICSIAVVPVSASNNRDQPVAMFCGRLDRCLLWAETAVRGKGRLPVHLRRSRSRSETAALRRLRPSVSRKQPPFAGAAANGPYRTRCCRSYSVPAAGEHRSNRSACSTCKGECRLSQERRQGQMQDDGRPKEDAAQAAREAEVGEIERDQCAIG